MSFAYVTLATPEFLPGILALRNTLKRHTLLPLVVMCQDLRLTDRRELIRLGMGVIAVESIKNPYLARRAEDADRFEHTYTKLRAFGLTQFERIVFIDADCLVFRPIDDLFKKTGFWAAPDYGIDLVRTRFNSGVMVIEPKQATFDDMMKRVPNLVSVDNSDQGFLNRYFSGRWQPLDYTYNTLKRILVHHKRLWVPEHIKVLHMVGKKPWFRGKQREDDSYYKLNVLWEKCKRGELCTL